jgi:sigma-B regulation protein RsbU (phosphoserine phosphatase)
MFVTVFLGVLDPVNGTLVYCNAGHHPPYLLRTREPGTSAVEVLQRTGMPLGILESATWKQDSVQLGTGDTLILYTDGVTDAHSPEETFYDGHRLLKAAQQHLGRSAVAIKTELLESVHAFVDGAPQFDDITLVVVVRDE